MLNTIKAIDTNYKGYRFRSRLEARWAVFFDALDIKWEYEKEGYQLSDGTKYLPDFYLPDLHVFVEVKPDSVDKKTVDSLMRKFRDDVGAIILVTGMPNYSGGDCVLYCHDLTDSSGGSSEWEVTFTPHGLESDNPSLLFGGRELFANYWEKVIPVSHGEGYGYLAVDEAASKAKSARFEFGENGVVP